MKGNSATEQTSACYFRLYSDKHTERN